MFDNLSDKLQEIIKKASGNASLTEENMSEAWREVRRALLEADVNLKVVKIFMSDLKEKALGEDVIHGVNPSQQLVKIVHDELVNILGNENKPLELKSHPSLIMMLGLQGSGKTTHSAKLAKMLKDDGHRPMLAACDIYRPAAIQQLQVVGEKAGVKVFEMGQIDPVIIAKQAVRYAKDYGHDYVILDTAGRLHIDTELMEELQNIKTATEPDEIMLVVDAMTGQDAVNVAKAFDDALGIDSVLMSKLDSDTRGGAALSVLAVTGKPIKFVGTGEKLDNFELFHPSRMASRILGMGDVLSLIERAETVIDKKDAEKLTKKLTSEGFDMNDLLEQLKQIRKMGSLKSIVSMLPGGDKIPEDALDERYSYRLEAMILSMTPAERAKPSIINPQRKRRIAAGSGTKVEDVNRLLKQFEQMQKMMKRFTPKNGKKNKAMMRQARRAFAGMNFDNPNNPPAKKK